MTICVLTEDSSKKSGRAYQVLAKKVLGRQRVILKSLPRGELLNARKLAVHFDMWSNSARIGKAIICIDSHSDPERMAAATIDAQKGLADHIRFPVEYVIVVHALETWLVEDHLAVAKVLGTSITKERLREIGNSCRPDRALGRVCDSFDKSVHDERLAREADVRIIASRNPSFKDFVVKMKGV